MGKNAITSIGEFLLARFGSDAPQHVARFRAELLARGELLGAARLGCVQALWAYTKSPTPHSVEPEWPRLYFGTT